MGLLDVVLAVIAVVFILLGAITLFVIICSVIVSKDSSWEMFLEDKNERESK